MNHLGFDGKKQRMLILFLIVGTGCLLALLWHQNNLLSVVCQSSAQCLVQMGFEESDTVSYVQQETAETEETWFLKAVPVLAYLSGNQEQLAFRESKDVSSFALLYPGKSSANGIWSGAACHWSRGEQLFEAVEEASDSVLAEETEEEEYVAAAVELDADSAALDAVLEENEAYAKQEQETAEEQETNSSDAKKKLQHLKSTQSLSYLLKNFYIVDSSTSIDKKVFDVETLLHTSLALKKKSEPQILIYHTHGASEHFIDSDPDKKSESVVGVGGYLAELLEEKYGYQVIHDETEYDRINGKIDRNKAYNKAYAGLKQNLKKYPSIQVVIDLHRDGVGNKVHRVTTVNGKRTAQIMFFNGLSRNTKGAIDYLKNDNLQANLAFSLQMKMKCMELYPNLAKPVYLKSYRYNLHLRKRSMLIELGNENNTLQEAKNAMEPLAQVLNQVLSGK